MRTKDDHMRNGQLKPCYNGQIGTDEQYITTFGIYQTPGDMTTLISMLDLHKEKYNSYPDIAVADAGYGSEENYEFMGEMNIDGFVKYNMFDKEVNGTLDKEKPYRSDTLIYNEKEDVFICPNGQRMKKIGNSIRTTSTGYRQNITKYQCEKSCIACPLKEACNPKTDQRIINVNHRINELRKQAREKLTSSAGCRHRIKRTIEPEPVFGNIKRNMKFTRFSLRGKHKVQAEFGLVCIAHNLKKFANRKIK